MPLVGVWGRPIRRASGTWTCSEQVSQQQISTAIGMGCWTARSKACIGGLLCTQCIALIESPLLNCPRCIALIALPSSHRPHCIALIASPSSRRPRRIALIALLALITLRSYLPTTKATKQPLAQNIPNQAPPRNIFVPEKPLSPPRHRLARGSPLEV